MKKIFFIIISIILSFFAFKIHSNSIYSWNESIGTINNVFKLSESIYGCKLTYKIEVEGEKNIINQYYMDLKEEPISNQTLKLKYNPKEPIIFILEDKIKYIKKL